MGDGKVMLSGVYNHFPNSIRRTKELEAKDLLFVDCGVSGGEEDARYGSSMMLGGSAEA
jgi:6-phosphogluconate dehydrogenase